MWADKEISHIRHLSSAHNFPLLIDCIHVVYLFQLMNHYWCIIINSTFCVIKSMGFHKCLISCIHHYNIIQNSMIHCPKNTIYSIYSTLPSIPQDPGNPWYFYCFYSFAISRLPYNWIYTVCNLFWLASFS